MANFITDESVDELKQTSISTGLHLNLIEGKPVTDPSLVKTLIDHSGNFLPWRQLLVNFILNKINKKDLETEIENQLQTLQLKGLTISHVDSHKHIHQYPVLGPFILETVKKLGISRIRNCTPSNSKHYRMLTLSLFSLITKSRLSSFKTPQRLITHFSVNGNTYKEHFIKELSATFEKFDVLEVMTHPSIRNRPDYYNNRKSEYDYLKHTFIQEKSKLKNVVLSSYLEI